MGESVLDFAAKYLEEGLKAGLNARQICIFMTTQLPVEVRQAAKEWIIAKGEGFSETEGISFAIKSRDLLYAKGLPLTLRFRDRGIEKVSHLRSPMVEPQNADDSSGGESSSGIEASRQSNRVRVIGRKPKYTTANYSEGHQGSECLFVKKLGHGYKMCPNRPCGVCGQLGHKPFHCPKGYPSRTSNKREHKNYRDRILAVGTGEDAVTVQVVFNGHELPALLDTGARPSVIDHSTLLRLDLEQNIIKEPGKMLGLCDNPINVLGYINAKVKVGNVQLLCSDSKFWIQTTPHLSWDAHLWVDSEKYPSILKGAG